MNAAPAPLCQAQAHWQSIDFISDLHLRADQLATFDRLCDYLQHTPADALFILGDLFEFWPGDDVVEGSAATALESRCADVLLTASRHMSLFFMHGNRDFLLGELFASRCGLTLLADPCVLSFAGRRWLLSHGDALCLDDVEYQRFRAQVRTPSWQQKFLAQPLDQRRAQAQAIRQFSEATKSSRNSAGMALVDLDREAARRWLQDAQASTLIHGHTHQPRRHDLGDGLSRVVLADWDAGADPPRGDVLRLCADDAHGAISRLAPT